MCTYFEQVVVRREGLYHASRLDSGAIIWCVCGSLETFTIAHDYITLKNKKT